jgi:methylated-DNA-[protein]-cysteine S-methyltransferase
VRSERTAKTSPVAPTTLTSVPKKAGAAKNNADVLIIAAANTPQDWTTFPTALGICGIGWSASGVTAFCLPETSADAVVARLKTLTQNPRAAAKPPAWIKTLIASVKAHLKGDAQDFSAVPLAIAGTEFLQAVYRAAQTIPAGSVLTYGELAALLGKPGATRAVGTALGKNPIPLLIPCHRIVANGRQPGGFSAPGGLPAKLALLDCEGVTLQPPPVVADNSQWLKAIAALQKQDKTIARLIKRVAPFAFVPHLRDEPLTSFISAITSQQLSVKAAATIFKRVLALIAIDGVVHPEKLLRISDDELRGAGLSYMKVSYLKDLAQKYVDGELPTLAQIQQMSDEQIIKRFTQVKGIGRWTVEMYLIFNLGRTDVFPTLDLGVRKGIAQLFKLAEMPDAVTAMAYGEKWKPYRSIASLYLWRSLDNQ